MLECKRCGAMLAPTDKFCTNCGTSTGLAEILAAQQAQDAAKQEEPAVQEEVKPEVMPPIAEETKPEPEAVKAEGKSDEPDDAKEREQKAEAPGTEQKTASAQVRKSASAGAARSGVSIPEAYRPLGMWSYFGYEVLFAIPIVGIIFLLIYALGGTPNINLRNFARAHFCFMILTCILSVIAAVFIFISVMR